MSTLRGKTFTKKLSANEALLVTRYRLGLFDIVTDEKGWRVVMREHAVSK